MVNYCRVVGCHNRSDRETHLKYYRLPKVVKNQGEECVKLSEERRRLWLARLQQNFDGKNIENIRVCSAHFISGKRAELYQRDNPDWAPSLNMTGSAKVNSDEGAETSNLLSPQMTRFKRCKRRAEKKKETFAAESLFSLQESESNVDSEEKNDTGIECQTDITSDFLESMTQELQCLRTENIYLNEEIRKFDKYIPSSFDGKKERVLYFTGLPNYQILMTLFTYLEPFLPVKKSMEKFTMFIMTLMKLRLNVSSTFLSYEFNISSATVSRIFLEVVDVMYVRMKPFIIWPDRDELRKTMPMQFRKHFGTKCVVIIDCFEIFIDRPSNPKARAETWSSYKHHNTVKFFIGITPQGTVSYISKAWGGRVSDKYITENDGFLNKILPGDLILADRGFDIQASVGSMMAEVKLPAFTKGKYQLSPLDLETTRKIANVRIHVERVIGTVRQKYTILNGPLPVDFLTCRDDENITVIDKICLVCCACVNLCDSVVDFN
ncbi:hypothetical protein ACJMK2_000860 [Sinanodonta woodiana]|uniref:THAP-type domain-containing protein n=2 Tax=Sinanodonta woodiana TaxID=1069815 RepID=A0ABD3XTZ7_SINWO